MCVIQTRRGTDRWRSGRTSLAGPRALVAAPAGAANNTELLEPCLNGRHAGPTAQVDKKREGSDEARRNERSRSEQVREKRLARRETFANNGEKARPTGGFCKQRAED